MSDGTTATIFRDDSDTRQAQQDYRERMRSLSDPTRPLQDRVNQIVDENLEVLRILYPAMQPETVSVLRIKLTSELGVALGLSLRIGGRI
jgi:hypothetical protein